MRGRRTAALAGGRVAMRSGSNSRSTPTRAAQLACRAIPSIAGHGSGTEEKTVSSGASTSTRPATPAGRERRTEPLM